MFKKLIIVLMLLVGFAATSSAQVVPDVDNPSAVTFTPSVDHALIDSYELDIVRPDGSVLQTINLGKPTPVANVITASINVQPVAFAVGYTTRVRTKAGTAVSTDAISVNKFNRRPGGPSNLQNK